MPLARAKNDQSTDLPASKLVKLDRGDIYKVSEMLQEMAGRHDLKIQDIRTDANDIMNSTGHMLVRVHATGDFMKFREFLVDRGTIPPLEQIEKINIRAIEGNREYRLKIWMAQKLTEDRGRKTEGRGQRTEGREQRAEDGRQRTEDRGRKTEDRGLRDEDWRQMEGFRRPVSFALRLIVLVARNA